MSHSYVVRPQTPTRRIRRQTSLEYVLNFSLLSPAPHAHQIEEATLLYFLILDECERDGIILVNPPGDGDIHEEGPDLARNDAVAEMNELLAEYESVEPRSDDEADGETEPANHDGAIPLHKLFRCIHEYCPTDDGQVNVVRIVLHGLFPVLHVDHDHVETGDDRSLREILPRALAWLDFSADQKQTIYRTLAAFAADFLQKFFAPLKAQGRCTPAVSTLITPTSRTEPGPDQGTSTRLGNLRRLCLARDGNRCVVSGQLDSSYLMRLYERAGAQQPRGPTGVKTEAAHIIPHSLNALTGESSDLSPSKCTVWRILNMFDPGISHVLAGPLIDSPANAMMLVPELHDRFGRLQCYLQEDPDLANTYTFHTTRGTVPLPPSYAADGRRVVFQNRERDPTGPKAELPLPRLLRIHRACCLMLSMSGAAEYVEKLLRDMETMMERGVLAADGSSNLELLLRLRGLEDMAGDFEIDKRVELMAH